MAQVLRYFHLDPRKTTVRESSVVDNRGTTLTNKITNINTSIVNNTQAIDEKQDTIPGKSLSSNDFTNYYKSKLDNIEERAEVNVLADWDENDSTADSYIQNKPGIDTVVIEDSNNLITSGAVFNAIDELPEPMIFKGSLGTGGTIQVLPTADNTNVGYTYKVITAGTYDGKTAKPGDTYISDGTEWILIPSGDEPSGTVTNVAMTVPTGLSVSGSPITTSGTLAITYAVGYAIPTLTDQATWTAKQDAISDLSTIRSRADEGHTAYSWGNHANAGYLMAISDLAIIRSRADEGHTAYGWGDHALAGYQAAISDLATIRSRSDEGHTAYGWGDHSQAGYVKSSGVTKVSMTVPTGLSISGSPITTTGTLALSFANGYSIPTTTKLSNWDTAYGWGDHSVLGYLKSITKAMVTTALGYTPPTQDTNTTYSAGTGLSLSGTTFSVKTSYTTDGNNRAVQADSNGNLYVVLKDNNTWTAMTGATASANGTVGYINSAPPKDGYNTKYWRADGTWSTPPDNNTTYTIATGDSNGLIKVTPSSGSAYNVSVKGLGSAAYLDADTSATANTVVKRDANKYIYGTYFNSSISNENINSYTNDPAIMFTSNDKWIRRTTKANLLTWLGLGSRAYDSTSYLPLAGGTMTGAIILPQDKCQLVFRNDSTWGTYLYYHTSDDEALTFSTKKAATSYIFMNGTTDSDGIGYASLGNPALQIKNNKVSIACAMRTRSTESSSPQSETLLVNGTGKFTNDLTLDGGNVYIMGGTSGTRKFGFKRTNNNTNIDVGWDWTDRDGSGAFFKSVDDSSGGSFGFFARNATAYAQLIGKPDGTFQWLPTGGGTWYNILHAGNYSNYALPRYNDSSLDANDATEGWHNVRSSITNGADTNHSTLIYVSNIGTPYQLQIPDSSKLYIYKRWYSSSTWSAWSKINAGYADSAGTATSATSASNLSSTTTTTFTGISYHAGQDGVQNDTTARGWGIPQEATADYLYKNVQILRLAWTDNTYSTDILTSPDAHKDTGLFYRLLVNGSYATPTGSVHGGWRQILDACNYSRYALPTTNPTVNLYLLFNAYPGHGSGTCLIYYNLANDVLRTNNVGNINLAGNLVWHLGNDGSGSGLDADLLDGYHASSFAISGHTHSYLPLSGGTLSGKLQINALLFGYNYTNSNNRAAFMFDKPGSNYTGIGAHGTSSLIWFGACDANGDWIDSFKLSWEFNGTAKADSLYIADHLFTTTSNYLTIACKSNEVVLAGDNTTMYFNYRTYTGKTIPTTFKWNAGSSSTWAAHDMGSLTARGTVDIYPTGHRSGTGVQISQGSSFDGPQIILDTLCTNDTIGTGSDYSAIALSKTAGTMYIRYPAGKTLSVGPFNLSTAYGYFNSSGGWTGPSDASLKKDIYKPSKTESHDIWEWLVEKGFKRFTWINTEKHDIGAIAQEVLEILPEVVDYNESTKLYGLDYTKLHSHAISSIVQELKDTKEEIKLLQALIAELKLLLNN